MNRLSILFLLMLPLSTLAQQFQVVRVDSSTFQSRQDTMLTVRFDSVSVSGQDTVHYLHRITGVQSNLPGGCTVTTDSINWAGKQILIKGKAKNLFINRSGDTITFDILKIVPEFNFGVSQIIYRFANGDRIRATVTGDEYVQQYGMFKRFKTLRLSVEDDQGNGVIHPMNGKDIIIHERLGVHKIYDLWNFPNDTTPIHIAGNPRYEFGATGMHAQDVFNIQPGHERHYLTQYESCGFVGCRQVETREKLFTLERDTSANGDTLWLTHQRTRLKFISDPVDGEDTVFTQDTIQQEIVWADWEFLDHNPNEWFNYAPGIDGYSVAYRTDTTGPRFRKELILDYTYDPVNHCLIPNAPGNNLPAWQFGDGLGIAYYQMDTTGVSTYNKRLVYYQRGIEMWGDPFDFQRWTGTEKAVWDQLQGYPNPATSDFRLTGLPEGKIHLQLLALDGRLLHQEVIQSETYVLNLSGLPAGLYLIRLQQEDHQRAIRVIKN